MPFTNGHGQCDLWLVDRATGAAEVWINNWNSRSGEMSWNKRGIVTGKAKCTQGWGVGLYDIGLRFHDIEYICISRPASCKIAKVFFYSGDGRADYLCIE